MSLESSLQEKREIFLSLLEKIESKVKEYYALGPGKVFKKILFSKEKPLLKLEV